MVHRNNPPNDAIAINRPDDAIVINRTNAAIRDELNDRLESGDLLFKNCETSVELGKIIQLGQVLNSLSPFSDTRLRNVKWEHAAIAVNETGTIIEAISSGVTVNEITRHADYIVLRCNNNDVARAAAGVADMFFQNRIDAQNPQNNPQDIFQYSKKGALKAWCSSRNAAPSLEDADELINRFFPNDPGNDRNLFCSQFVAICYILGASQVENQHPENFIEQRDNVLTPAQMVSLLEQNNNWISVGVIPRHA